jgi:hypothetical protein
VFYCDLKVGHRGGRNLGVDAQVLPGEEVGDRGHVDVYLLHEPPLV